MIYDCFTFFNEYDLLELRLRLLDKVVDYFVLCEAPFTFRGTPKPLYFALGADRFARWRERIIPLVYPEAADPDPWKNEWGQRDHLIAGLARASDDDLVLIGDCDEIPDPANVHRRPQTHDILAHVQRLYLGYLNRQSDQPWIGTRAIAVGSIPRHGTLTAVRGRPPWEFETVEGGWHFSSLGGAAVAEQKMRAYSHAEYDVPYYRDAQRLALSFESAKDGRWVPLDEVLVPLAREPRFARHIWAKPAPVEERELAVLEHAHGCLGYVPPGAGDVLAVSREPALWERAGKARFSAFRAARELDELVARAHPGAWVVLDGLELQPAAALRALRATGAAAVAYARNARSRDVLDDVVKGAAFPTGRAHGRAEFEAWLAELGWAITGLDRIASPGVFALLGQFPERLGVEFGRMRFGTIARERLSELLARAFIFTLRA